MAGNPIKYSDIISDDVPEGIKDLIALITKLDKAADETRQRILELGKQLQKNSNDNAEGIKKQEAAIRGLSEEEKQLIAIEKERAKAELEIQRTIKLQNQAAELAIKNSSSQQGAYKKLSDELNKLRKEYKNLAAEENGESREAKKLLSTIDQLDAKLKKIDSTVGQHQRSVGNYGKAWESAKATIKGWGVAALAAVGVQEVWNKAITVSDTLGDSWEKTLTKGNAAINVFFTSLATGNFSGFVDRLKEAVTVAGYFAEKMDALGDKEEAYNIISSESQIVLQKIRNEMKLSNTTAERRLKLAEEYDKIVEDDLARSLELESKRKNLLIDRIAAETSVNRTEAKWFVDNYSRNSNLIEVAGELNDKISEYEKNKKKIAIQSVYGTFQQKEIDNAVERNKVLSKEIFNLSAEQRQFLKLFPILKEDATLWQEIVKSIQKHNQYLYEAEALKGQSMKASARAESQEKKQFNSSEKNSIELLKIAQEKAKEEIEYNEAVESELLAGDKRQLENKRELSVSQNEITRNSMLEQLGIVREVNDSIRMDNMQTQDEINADLEKSAALRAEIELATKEAIFTDLQAIEDSFFDYKQKLLDQEMSAKLEAASEDEEAQKRIKKKYAKQERDLAIFQINLNTLMAVAKIWATQGYPAGIGSTIAVSASGAAQLIQTEAAYQALKFKKGGHGIVNGASHENGGVKVPGVGEVEGDEWFGVLSKEKTKKYAPVADAFIDSLNSDKLDLFALNFVPKIQVGNTDRLQDIAIKQLQVQRETKEILYKQKVLKGRTEIDINGNRTHYC